MPISLPPTPPAIVLDVSEIDSRSSDLLIAQTDSQVRLLTQERGGNEREFTIPLPSTSPVEPIPTTIPIPDLSLVEVVADQQEYDDRNQIVTASGNVIMRFNQAILIADRLQINLKDRLAVAQGKVTLTRGQQILRGERFEYYFALDQGTVYAANGEIYQSTISQDIGGNLPSRTSNDPLSPQLLNERLFLNQPVQNVTGGEGLSVTLGSDRPIDPLATEEEKSGSTIDRLRFSAERLEFDGDTWAAQNLSLTNDPFSPPELEVKADAARFTNFADNGSELVTDNARVVIDNNVSLPLIQNVYSLNRTALFKLGYDDGDRGGLFLERPFQIFDRDRFSWTLTPQYFLQRAIFDVDPIDPSVFGFKTNINYDLRDRTSLSGNLSVTSFDADEIADNTRAKTQLTQRIGDLANPHHLSLDYNFRERLFNGSLGFQTVQNSFGLVLVSPRITLGDTGIALKYRASVLNIDAATDRADLLVDNEIGDDVINLTRYQASIGLSKEFLLWAGDSLPPTPEAGLRYTATPVVPYLQLYTGITGVTSRYSNGEHQDSLRGTVGLEGQFGHSADDFFDYTGFNISYSNSLITNESPFKFDRFVDQETLSFGIVQQIYGPVRIGFQTAYNLDNGNEISTDYYLEYSRRTFNIVIRYNPILELGSLSFRLNDFNWVGSPEPFPESDVGTVIQGIE
jgi:hypothetical protein